MPIRELARAKINLTLTVHGRRPDGYHELESLVAFADVADEVTFQPGADLGVATTGPFAAEIVGGTPQQFDAFIKSELKRWPEVVKAAGIKAE